MEHCESHRASYSMDGLFSCVSCTLVLGNSQRVVDLGWLRRVPVICLGQEFS